MSELSRCDIAAWRARADGLRGLAASIDVAARAGLAEQGGPDTWLGPAADEFVADAAMASSRLAASAMDLRVAAYRLDEQAQHAEAALIREEILRAGLR